MVWFRVYGFRVLGLGGFGVQWYHVFYRIMLVATYMVTAGAAVTVCPKSMRQLHDQKKILSPKVAIVENVPYTFPYRPTGTLHKSYGLNS